MFRIITYDITNDRRRTQLAKTLEGFGYRVQYSVFEARLNHTQYRKMKDTVSQMIDIKEDSVRFYTLCNPCCQRVEVVGVGQISSPSETIIV